jgi:magnesium chelatase family protein
VQELDPVVARALAGAIQKSPDGPHPLVIAKATYCGCDDLPCRCSPKQLARSAGWWQGALAQSFEVCVPLGGAVCGRQDSGDDRVVTSAEMRQRIVAARARRRDRLGAPAGATQISPDVEQYLHVAVTEGRLAADGGDVVRRVAWSIADLEGHASPSHLDMLEALLLVSPPHRAGCQGLRPIPARQRLP